MPYADSEKVAARRTTGPSSELHDLRHESAASKGIGK